MHANDWIHLLWIQKQKDYQESKVKALVKHNKKIKPRSGCTAHSDIRYQLCLLVKLFDGGGFLPQVNRSRQVFKRFNRSFLFLFLY